MNTTEYKVLDKGFVRYIDHMGTDADIAKAARISYGRQDENRSHDEDRNLIRYMMSGGYELKCPHSSPFEMCELKTHIRIPMDAWRQMVRHRTANINEYSTRYSEAIDDKQQTIEWRSQSKIISKEVEQTLSNGLKNISINLLILCFQLLLNREL